MRAASRRRGVPAENISARQTATVADNHGPRAEGKDAGGRSCVGAGEGLAEQQRAIVHRGGSGVEVGIHPIEDDRAGSKRSDATCAGDDLAAGVTAEVEAVPGPRHVNPGRACEGDVPGQGGGLVAAAVQDAQGTIAVEADTVEGEWLGESEAGFNLQGETGVHRGGAAAFYGLRDRRAERHGGRRHDQSRYIGPCEWTAKGHRVGCNISHIGSSHGDVSTQQRGVGKRIQSRFNGGRGGKARPGVGRDRCGGRSVELDRKATRRPRSDGEGLHFAHHSAQGVGTAHAQESAVHRGETAVSVGTTEPGHSVA